MSARRVTPATTDTKATERPRAARPARRSAAWQGFIIAFLLASIWIPATSERMAWGRDEATRVGLPAARLAVAAAERDLGAAADTLLACDEDPFAYPVVLAASQSAFGVSQRVARRTGRAVWALALWGLFLVVRRAVLRAERVRGEPLRGGGFAPWVALAAGAASPLALASSGTLFLQVPFACAAAFALLAWLRRAEPHEAPAFGRELVAGLMLSVAFFTEFELGLWLGFGLALDLAFDFASALRADRGGTFLVRSLLLASVPLALLTWWFVLPVPGDFTTGELHRLAFSSVLAGGAEPALSAWNERLMDAVASLVTSPRAFVLLVLGLLVALRTVFTRGPRTLWLVALVFVVQVCVGPDYLERDLISCAVPLFALSALGLAALLPRNNVGRVLVAALVGFAACWSPRLDSEGVAERLGVLTDGDSSVSGRSARAQLLERTSLSPWRSLPTGGLSAYQMNAVVDRIGRDLQPGACPQRIGVDLEPSQAAIWLGLLEQGWSAETFLSCSAMSGR